MEVPKIRARTIAEGVHMCGACLHVVRASDSRAARQAIADYQSFPIERFDHLLVLNRVWDLRHRISTGHAARIEFID